MKAFGFLSFGHYADVQGSGTRTAGDMLHQTIDLAVGADELGVKGGTRTRCSLPKNPLLLT